MSVPDPFRRVWTQEEKLADPVGHREEKKAEKR